MMTSSRQILSFSAGALFALAFVLTCDSGDDAGYGRGRGGGGGGQDTLIGADTPGGADASWEVSVGDAAADETSWPGGMTTQVFQGACTHEQVRTTTHSSGYVSTETRYYAEVQVPGLDPRQAPHLEVVVCDHVCEGQGCDDWCGDDMQCQTEGWAKPERHCQQAGMYAELYPGRLIVYCGTRATGSDDYQPWSYRWQNVFARVTR
jgi:hypothetical protein